MSRRTAFGLLLILLLVAGCAGAPDPRPSVYREAERLLVRGMQAYDDNRYPDAAELFAQALASYRSVDDRPGMLLAYTNLAETALAIGNEPAGRTHLECASALAVELADRPLRRRLTLLGASLAIRSGDLLEAERRLDDLLAETPAQATDPITRGALGERALLAIERGTDPMPWLERYRATFSFGTATPFAKARLQRIEGEVLRLSGRLDEARERLQQALSGYKAVAYRPGIAASLEGLALVALARGEGVAARDLLQRALYIRVWIFDRPASLRLLGRLAALEGEGNGAFARYRALQDALIDPGFSDWDALRALFDTP